MPRDSAMLREAEAERDIAEAARWTPNAAASVTLRASQRTMASKAARSDRRRRETRSQPCGRTGVRNHVNYRRYLTVRGSPAYPRQY